MDESRALSWRALGVGSGSGGWGEVAELCLPETSGDRERCARLAGVPRGGWRGRVRPGSLAGGLATPVYIA